MPKNSKRLNKEQLIKLDEFKKANLEAFDKDVRSMTFIRDNVWKYCKENLSNMYESSKVLDILSAAFQSGLREYEKKILVKDLDCTKYYDEKYKPLVEMFGEMDVAFAAENITTAKRAIDAMITQMTREKPFTDFAEDKVFTYSEEELAKKREALEKLAEEQFRKQCQ